MPEPTDTADFFRPRLAEMIDLRHPLAVLASRLPWTQIEAALAPYFARRVRAGRVLEHDDLFGPSLQVVGAGVAAAGRPRLPIRLMASLLYLKHAFKLSDEELVERWAENVVWQFFSGLTFYEPRLPCDATQIGRFRAALGEAGVEELLKATIDTAVASKAIRPAEFERVIVDTTVQEKAIAHPVDSRLLEIARAKVVAAARRAGISLKQTFAREGSQLRRRAGGYAHAKQFKRLKRVLKRQRTVLGTRTSVTASGISGVEGSGNAGVHTGDGANALPRVNADVNSLMSEVNAQVQITAAFGQAASREIGAYANARLAEAGQLYAQADAEIDPARAAELRTQAAEIERNWGEGGIYRVAAHTLAGALAGGWGGAAGAAASSASIPYIAATVNATDLPDSVRAALIASASAALGATVGGGVQGAAAAFNEVINNCLASTCLSIKWDKDAPGYHAYGPISSPSLCNVAETGCMDAVKQQLACNSAPGQASCATTPGGTKEGVTLTGGNVISQYLSPNSEVVINGTTEGQHMLDNGYVMRWISVDAGGSARILTYGEGVNMSWYGIPGGMMGAVNSTFGPGLFMNLGTQNQVAVRNALLNNSR